MSLKVCVYCASSTKVKSDFFDAAIQLGKTFASNDIELIYGGGNNGLMGAIADSTLDNGGKVTGIIPRFMCDENWHHSNLSNLIIVDTMHERKHKMAIMADAVVALPGGCGTMEELMEVITWKQLGIFTQPIIIVNTNGYYNSLIEMLNNAVKENFMREIHLDMWTIVQTPIEVINALNTAPKWNKDVRKFAAI